MATVTIPGREKREEKQLCHIQGTKRASSLHNVKYEERQRVKNESVEMSTGSAHKDFLAMLRSLNSISRAIESL